MIPSGIPGGSLLSLPNSSIGLSSHEHVLRFQHGLLRLGSFPDRNAIRQLTDHAASAQSIHAREVVDIMLNQIIFQVAPSNKIPILYLADSIFKNVGGLYPELSGLYIVRVFTHTFEVVGEDDRVRLFRLLRTWERWPLFGPYLGELFSFTRPWVAQRELDPHANALEQAATTRVASVAPVRSINQSTRQQRPISIEVQNEMREILSRLQREMDEPHPIALEELWSQNPKLANQILVNAEMEISKKLNHSTSQSEQANPAANALTSVGGLHVDLDAARDLVTSLQRAVMNGDRKGDILSAAQTVSNHLALVLQNAARAVTEQANQRRKLVEPSFIAESLNQKNAAVISQLFRLPHYSSLDGMQFKHQQQLVAHEEMLQTRIRERRDEAAHGSASRPWFCTVEQWCSDFAQDASDSTNPMEGVPVESEDADVPAKEVLIVVDQAVTKCRICGEPFEMFWEDEVEEWMYRNAVRVKIQATPDPLDPTSDVTSTAVDIIVHRPCSDAVSTEGIVQVAQLMPETPKQSEKSNFTEATLLSSSPGWESASHSSASVTMMEEN